MVGGRVVGTAVVVVVVNLVVFLVVVVVVRVVVVVVVVGEVLGNLALSSASWDSLIHQGIFFFFSGTVGSAVTGSTSTSTC